jgi:hypothetical protein
MYLPQHRHAHPPSYLPNSRPAREPSTEQVQPVTTTSTSSTPTNFASMSSGRAMSHVMRTQLRAQVHPRHVRAPPLDSSPTVQSHPTLHPIPVTARPRVTIPAHLDLGLLTPITLNQVDSSRSISTMNMGRPRAASASVPSQLIDMLASAAVATSE